MARGRQIVGPRKVALLEIVTRGGQAVPVYDSSIDVTAMQANAGEPWRAYHESLYDSGRLVFIEGQKSTCTWWTIQPATMAQKLAAPESGLPRAAWLVRCCLTRIEGYMVTAADGSEAPIEQPDRGTGDMASGAWLLRCGLTEEEILALGQMIERLSEASGPLLKSSAKGSGDTGASPTGPAAPA